MNICVFGASSSEIAQEYICLAEELGEEMAKRGHSLVFGGGATGLMGAVSRGVRNAQGISIGVSPRFFDKPGILDKECTEFVWTETMRERKQIMEERSDAVIVLPGGIGTYEEFMEMLTLKQLGRVDKPIVLFNIRGYYDPMKLLLQHTAKEGFMGERCLRLCEFAETVKEAVSMVEKIDESVSGDENWPCFR